FNNKLVGWLEKMDLAYFLSMKDKVEIKDFDIILVEGVVSTERDKKEVEEMRANTKVLIAMGTCAMTALPSGQRNNFRPEQLENIQADLKKFSYLPKCLPIKDVVKVDDEIPGCPIIAEKFIEIFEKHLNQ
ncbi:MAG: hypothetical protein WCK11_04815, partial [Candidatus Falkowbacteria bacterium]